MSKRGFNASILFLLNLGLSGLYRIYRFARRVPGLAELANSALRLLRNIFWTYRPAATSAVPPEDFVAFLQWHLTEGNFTLIEIGAGDGRVLRHLARLFPSSQFIGVDIQKAAVTEGRRLTAEAGIHNVDLRNGSCMDNSLDWRCDYLIARTTLIYLNRRDIEQFLRKRLPQVRRKLLLTEIVSLSGESEISHFFAHPLADLAQQVGEECFTVTVRLLDYRPWMKMGHWSGADIVIARRALAD